MKQVFRSTLALLLGISLTMIAAACRSDSRVEEPAQSDGAVIADHTVEAPPPEDASVDVKTTGREWSFDIGVAGRSRQQRILGALVDHDLQRPATFGGGAFD